MAWTISTYAGTRMFGDPSNARTALFELMRAVNEREEAMVETKTQFRKADGTLASDLTIADIEDIQASGFSSDAKTNFFAIRNYLAGNAGNFTTTATSETAYTIGTLSTAVGYDLTTVPTRVAEAAPWQAYQDALGLLIYPWGHLVLPSASVATGTQSGVESTVATAWNNRTNSSYTPSFDDARISVAYVATGNWRAQIQNNATYTYTQWRPALSLVARSRPTVGTVNKAYAEYTTFGQRLSTTVAFTVAGESDSFSNGLDSNQLIEITPPSLTGSDPTVQVLVTVPSSSPFDEETTPTGDTQERRAWVDNTRVKIYFDISSELTDQA